MIRERSFIIVHLLIMGWDFIPVCSYDEYARVALHQMVKVLSQPGPKVLIQSGERVIQDEKPGILEPSPGDQNLAPFPIGKLDDVPSQQCPQFQDLDDVLSARCKSLVRVALAAVTYR